MSDATHTSHGALTVRPALEDDVALLLEAFEREGAPRPPDQLQHYLAEQGAGLRILLVAWLADETAGYLTLSWDADYPPFRRAGIPEIQDLNVLPSLRRRGVATRLLDAAEERAAERCPAIGLSVGLYSAYGPAQRLYSRCGYHPDGAGATSRHRPLLGGEMVAVDDSLALHLFKRLPSIS